MSLLSYSSSTASTDEYEIATDSSDSETTRIWNLGYAHYFDIEMIIQERDSWKSKLERLEARLEEEQKECERRRTEWSEHDITALIMWVLFCLAFVGAVVLRVAEEGGQATA